MTINERVRYLRKTLLGKTAEEFAPRLGVTRSAIANIETGNRNVTEQMFKLICQEYGVRPEWLKNGEGDPFQSHDRQEDIARLIKRVASEPDGSFKAKLLSVLSKLDEDQWELLAEIAQKIANEN